MLLTAKKLRRAYKTRRSEEEFRAICRAQFRNPGNIIPFGEFCFPHHLTKESPEFHYDLVDLLNSPGNIGLAAPRGHAKSTISDLVYLSWMIVNKKANFILVISDTYGQAVEFVNTLRNELSSNRVIRGIYGDLQGNTWGNGVFETNTGIKVMARGVGMKVRGLKYRQYRPDLALIDDIESDSSVRNPDQREKLKNWVTLALMPAMSKTGKVVVLGTIMHGDSLLKNITDRTGVFASWKTKVWKAMNEDSEGKAYSLWPGMYTVGELTRMRDDPEFILYKGSLVFQQEYQNEPIDEKDAIIKRQWIKRFTTLPVNIQYGAIFMDPAISKKDSADFTAKIMAHTDGTNVYVTRIGNNRMSFAESVEDVMEWNQKEKPKLVAIEMIAFQQAFGDVLRGLPVVQLQPDSDKVRRTISVSRFFEGGHFYIQEGIPNAELLIDQLVHFPSVKHDDLVDVCVYAVDKMLIKKFGTYGQVQEGSRGSGITADIESSKY